MKIDPNIFPENETTFFIAGPVGALEVKASSPDIAPLSITMIVCHPHPLFSGTMENKVVTTVYRTFKNMGMHVVRFNYRGVGKSEGSYGEAVGETEDLQYIISWVRKVRPHDQIWLAGFSFGAYVAASAASKTDVSQLLTIAPPVHHFDFESLPQPNCPWLVIQGDADEVVPAHLVYTWFDKLKQTSSQAVTLIKLEGTSHFFHGRLIELKEILATHYREVLS